MIIYTPKLSYDGNARNRNFHIAGRFLFIQAIEVWFFGTLRSFPIKTVFRYAQDPYKTGIYIYIYIYIYIGMKYWWNFTDRKKGFAGRKT